LHVQTKARVTTIRYVAGEQIEKAKMLGLFLMSFPGLPILLIGTYFETFPGYWNYVLMFYFLTAVGLLFYGSYERKIEIHPERIYVKNYLFVKEKEFPVKKNKMVLMLENSPYVQVIIPREKSRILVGYEDRICFFSEDFERGSEMRKIVSLLSKKFHIPVIDYTYEIQNEIILHLMPGELEMPFATRAVKYPDILVVGELPGEQGILEERKSSGEWIYNWTALTLKNFISSTILAAALAIMVILGIVGVKDSLFDIPFLPDSRIIYYMILMGYLGSIAYYSGIRKTLILKLDYIQYIIRFFGFKAKNVKISTAGVREVRARPIPGGFASIIIGKEGTIRMKTHMGGLYDFANLLWLTGRIQDFLLKNRETFPADKNQNDKSGASEDLTELEDTGEEETENEK